MSLQLVIYGGQDLTCSIACYDASCPSTQGKVAISLSIMQSTVPTSYSSLGKSAGDMGRCMWSSKQRRLLFTTFHGPVRRQTWVRRLPR